MNICFLCDLHLPVWREAIQYRMLEFVRKDIVKRQPDCIAFAGDATCDGDLSVYQQFISDMQALAIPFLYIPGNSDLRNPACRDAIKKMASPCENEFGRVRIYALNDCEGRISQEQYAVIDRADENSIVFLHHTLPTLPKETREQMQAWMKKHPDTLLFSGHKHFYARYGNEIYLPAMDPDKCIGEEPCIVYYDTESKEMQHVHFPCPLPEELKEYFGISCYKMEQIDFAIREGIQYLELRPSALEFDEMKLKERIAAWRKAGGKGLSIHLPDVGYQDGKAIAAEGYDELLQLAQALDADRLTQHVPRISVAKAEEDDAALDKIAACMAEKMNRLSGKITIGIENMHMTADDIPGKNRRFGYIPEECMAFARLLGGKCRYPVGYNFDIGHARNNAPYSQKYQIGTWMAMLGKDIVGYHMHQVTDADGGFSNHMPIRRLYDRVMSLASFFAYWKKGWIAHVPVIFEMRPEDAYEITLETFRNAITE